MNMPLDPESTLAEFCGLLLAIDSCLSTEDNEKLCCSKTSRGITVSFGLELEYAVFEL